MNKPNEFWKYFHEYLAFPWIAKVGALTVIVKGLSRSLDVAKMDIIAMRDQFIVPQADESLMADYGVSRGVPRTRFDKNEQYRIRTERAFIWHQLGGRELGLPQILDEYGYYGGVIHNKRHDNIELWAHFDIKLLEPGNSLEQEKVDAVYVIANMYKPARSILGAISFALKQDLPLYVGANQRHSITFVHTVATGTSDFKPIRIYQGATTGFMLTIEHTVK